MASSFQKEFIVSSYELNPRGLARLTTMANYFQEVAYHHANELGFGYEDMKKRRTMWLLSRMRIQMDRYPAWNDQVILETWPSGIDKIFAVRDFRVKDMQGEILGVASSYWLIVDLNTHRPIRPREELERYADIIYGDPVFPDKLEKIALPEDTQELAKHRVMFSDLDIVGHTNNVKYMEWSLDAYYAHSPKLRDVREFEINFMKECRLGDELVIRGSEAVAGETQVMSGKRNSDGVEAFRSRLEWKDNQIPG